MTPGASLAQADQFFFEILPGHGFLVSDLLPCLRLKDLFACCCVSHGTQNKNLFASCST